MLFKVENLSVGYSFPLLSDISFTVEDGEIVGIIGQNGQGKTTLLKGFLGDAKIFSGNVYVEEEEITALSAKKRATKLSLLAQKSLIPEGLSVRELLETGLYATLPFLRNPSAEAKRRIEKIAEELKISELSEKDCSLLSSGQQQLVLLCRMFVQNTPLMLLDEPNASLDLQNVNLLFNALRRSVKNGKKGALAVLHDPDTALRFCDRLLFLKDGKLINTVSVKTSSEEELQKAFSQLYPKLQIRKNPYREGYICYWEDE